MTKNLTLSKVFPYLIAILAAIGLIASLILSYDTLSIAHNSHYVPSCNLNPVISCGSVINAKGDTIFGLPYPYYGIAAFGALLSAAVMVMAGGRPNKYFWRLFLSISGIGVVGAYALLLKSVYSIHALCPFCLSVDVVTTTTFWYSLLYCIDNKYLALKSKKLTRVYAWCRKHHLDLLLAWFLLVAAVLLHHFWYYYGKHL